MQAEKLRQNHLGKDSFSEARSTCACVCSVVSNSATPDCSPPGSSVHGISQAKILEWVTVSFPRGSSQPKRVTIYRGRWYLTTQDRLASCWPTSPSSRSPTRPILTMKKLEGIQAKESFLPPHVVEWVCNILAGLMHLRSRWQTQGYVLLHVDILASPLES